MKQKTEIKEHSIVKHVFPFYKMVFTFVFVIGAAFYSHAQLQCGFKINAGGACQSDLLEITNNCDVRFSPSIGFVGKFQFTNAFALKSGLEYQAKGRKYNKHNTKLSNKLQYLHLPIKAELSAGEKAGFKNGQRVYFAAGPYLGYLLHAKGELNDTTISLKDNTKSFDFGLGFELGFEFPAFTNKALQLGLNYDMGLIEVYKNEDFTDLHNKMASISLAMLF